MEGEIKKAQDKGDLKEEPGEDVEGIAAPKMAAVVEPVKFFQPGGWMGKKIPDSGNVIRENRASRTGEQKRERVMTKKGRGKEDEEQAESQKLVGDGHGQNPLQANFPIGCGGHPMADA